MGTWNQFYLRTTEANLDAADAAVRKAFPNLEIKHHENWAAVDLGFDEFEAPEQKLATLSVQLKTDAIVLAFQSAVDAFQFYHWKNGDLLRRLIHGCFAEERTWEKADGVAEPWEVEAFFNPKNVELAIDCCDSEAEKNKIRQAAQEHLIEPGQTIPWVDAKGAAWAVGKFYKLPDFS
jgi:hypothetical protein